MLFRVRKRERDQGKIENRITKVSEQKQTDLHRLILSKTKVNMVHSTQLFLHYSQMTN